MQTECAVKTPAQSSDRHLPVVEKACAYLDQRAGERITLAELAEHVEMSPWHLQRLFKQVMGVSPRDYGDARRSARFRQGLKAGDSIAGATYEAGYGSSSRIYEAALSQLGMTPATYAKGGRGARIVYAIVDSPLDRLLVAMTGFGVCFVCLGEDDGALTRALEKFGNGSAFQIVAWLPRETTVASSKLEGRATGI